MSARAVFLYFICIIVFPFSVSAQQPQKKKKVRAQVAIVAVEGASVYKFPNFDAPIIEYLRAGTKVVASLKPRQGIGGFGAFYRVRLPNKKLGWMTDVDILPQYKDNPNSKSKTEENPDFNKVTDAQENSKREPIFFEKYLGAGIGLVQYSEKFEGRELSSDTMMLAFRAVGPELLFDGPPMDFTLAASIEAPDYYTEFANGPATGFFLIADALIPFPLMESGNNMFTLGLGPMLTYTNFKVQVSTSKIDSQELRLGVVGNLGYMHRFSDFGVKFDAKYFYEKTAYFGAQLSFMFHLK